MGDISTDFNRREFACKCGCGYDRIDPKVVAMAQKIRDILGEPLRINSACRCFAHNQKVGGVSDSYHTQGLAADLSCASGSAKLFAAVQALHAKGKLNGLEYCKHYGGKNFVHIDTGHRRGKRFIK